MMTHLQLLCPSGGLRSSHLLCSTLPDLRHRRHRTTLILGTLPDSVFGSLPSSTTGTRRVALRGVPRVRSHQDPGYTPGQRFGYCGAVGHDRPGGGARAAEDVLAARAHRLGRHQLHRQARTSRNTEKNQLKSSRACNPFVLKHALSVAQFISHGCARDQQAIPTGMVRNISLGSTLFV